MMLSSGRASGAHGGRSTPTDAPLARLVLAALAIGAAVFLGLTLQAASNPCLIALGAPAGLVERGQAIGQLLMVAGLAALAASAALGYRSRGTPGATLNALLGGVAAVELVSAGVLLFLTLTQGSWCGFWFLR